MEKTFEQKSESEEWGAWKFVSEMLDNPYGNGIYPTSVCYEKIHDFVVEQKKKAVTEERERIIKMVENKTKIGLPYGDELMLGNGNAISTPPPETSIWVDIVCSIRKGAMDDKQFKTTVDHILAQVREEAQREVLEDLLEYYYKQRKYKDSPFDVIVEEFCELENIIISNDKE